MSSEDAREDPEILPDWDYFTDLRVARSLFVDLPQLLEDTGLDNNSVVSAVLTWHSSWTGLRGSSNPISLMDGENHLAIDLEGERLGGRLALETRIVLENASTAHPLAPHRRGSTLWADSTRVVLEGSGARFPVVPAPFDKSGIAAGRLGAWSLSIESDDLSASSNGSLRLYLNSSHPAVNAMLSTPGSPEAQALADFIRYDVARQLMVRALTHKDLDDEVVYESDSLGEMFSTLLDGLFPDRDLATLRGDYNTASGELEAELQGRLGLMSQ
jgi:hypothetical protein